MEDGDIVVLVVIILPLITGLFVWFKIGRGIERFLESNKKTEEE